MSEARRLRLRVARADLAGLPSWVIGTATVDCPYLLDPRCGSAAHRKCFRLSGDAFEALAQTEGDEILRHEACGARATRSCTVNSSQDDRISKLLAELSAMIPGEGGRVVIEDGPDETFVKADRLGFLRLGIGLAHGTHLPITTAYGIHGAVESKRTTYSIRTDTSRLFFSKSTSGHQRGTALSKEGPTNADHRLGARDRGSMRSRSRSRAHPRAVQSVIFRLLYLPCHLRPTRAGVAPPQTHAAQA